MSNIGKFLLLGGGGFSIDADPAMDRYLVQLVPKPRPSICFVPTASGDSENYCRRFREAFTSLGCDVHVLSLFKPLVADLRGFLEGMDIVFVGGGNTKNLLALWREWKLDEAILAASRAGTLVSGVSAGLICWFQEGITDSEYGPFKPLQGIGHLRGLAAPHFDSTLERQAVFEKRFAETAFDVGYGVPDGVAVEFEAGMFVRSVSARDGAGVHVYSRSGDGRVLRRLLLAERIS